MTILPNGIEVEGLAREFKGGVRAVDGIEARSARMGAWGFTRIAFGPLTGYTSGWCDLPHWGLVLRGDVVLRSETDSELLTQGDVFYRPPGPPGHQFEVADAATIIDYTPLEALRSADRREAWRPRVRGHGPVDTSL